MFLRSADMTTCNAFTSAVKSGVESVMCQILTDSHASGNVIQSKITIINGFKRRDILVSESDDKTSEHY